MSGFGLYQAHDAIFDRLNGDAALLAMVTGIFDFPPEDTSYPYIVIGDAKSNDASNISKAGMACEIVIQAFSRYKGRKQALDILTRVYDLLHGQALSLGGGQSLAYINFSASEVFAENDGVTYQGWIRFAVVTVEV